MKVHVVAFCLFCGNFSSHRHGNMISSPIVETHGLGGSLTQLMRTGTMAANDVESFFLISLAAFSLHST